MDSKKEFRTTPDDELQIKMKGILKQFSELEGVTHNVHATKKFNKNRLEVSNEIVRKMKSLNEKSITCYSYGCNNKVAYNHLFSKNWIEREIKENKNGVTEIRKPNFAKRKLNKASTFNFLCSDCDKKMFKLIDLSSLKKVKEDLQSGDYTLLNILGLRSLMAAYSLALDTVIMNLTFEDENLLNFQDFYIAEKSLLKNKRTIQDLSLGVLSKKPIKNLKNELFVLDSKSFNWDLLFFMHYVIEGDSFTIVTSINEGDKLYIIVSKVKISDSIAKESSKQYYKNFQINSFYNHFANSQLAIIKGDPKLS